MMFRLIAEERNEIRRSDKALQTCFIAIERNHDPTVQKHILGSQFIVIGTSDGAAGRTPPIGTRPAQTS